MKSPKNNPLRDFYPYPYHKPSKTGNYRVYDGKSFSASYWNGSEFEIEVSHWSNRSKRTF